MRKAVLILITLISLQLRAQVNLNLGLMAYYPFSGNANDVSGNNNNPSFNNATLTADRFGTANSAYHFNGTSNYMRIPNSPSINTGNLISICSWVRVTGFYQGPCHGNSMVMKGDVDYLTGNYLLRFDDGAYTNYQNCVNPVPDVIHQTFYGVNLPLPGGYTPYIQNGQWASVIYTSDGTTSKLYVNCVLKISGPAGSFTFSNAYDLFFGKMNNPSFPYWLNGDLDEIRIYNRALNQQEVDVLGGCAMSISNIINTYTPVLALNPCDNKITVEDGTTFNTNDTVLIIQMKGAVVDSSNTASFGTITDYKNAGNYEFNFVKSRTGNIIELKNKMTRQYDLPDGKVQLIRVPYYQDATVTSTLTCLPWDGSKGGVLVLNVWDSLVLNANIDVSGNGFKGGNDPVSNPGSFFCNESNYYYPVNPDLASGKGEGIAIISASKSFGRGDLANGGGGGNSHNSGGGGGSNASAGGFGGYNFEGSPCTNVPFDNRGIGGRALTYSNAANKIFMGGGGGAGHSNNPEAFQATGGNGSGIVIINAARLISNGNKIIAKGNNGASCAGTGSGCHEGMGGGGAGGAVILRISNYPDPSVIEIMGGNGANMTAAGFQKVGPGGGGSGGKVWFMDPSLPAPVTVTVTGGANGVCTGYANDPWGATQGQLGSLLFNQVMPLDIIPFTPNIDSVRIKDSATSCSSFDFKGFGYTNTNPINSWQWFFGDGGTATTQNTSHTYASNGTFIVKLIVTDINGCKDSITKNITVTCLDPIGSIINSYTPVLAIDICQNMVTVEDAATFNTGDTVLLIQMKGAVIDSTNTAAFGTITDYKNAGNYEFNYVKSKTGNIIELKNTITRQYDLPGGKVQLVRVPYYQNATITSTLSCLPWDGNKGGILVLNVQDSIILNANIDVSGKGFRGAAGFNTGMLVTNCFTNNYNYPVNSLVAAQKGESITTISNNIISGKGSPASGGGGGLDHNSGGGGGGNGGTGGFGGYQLEPCGSSPFDNRGIGGKNLAYSTATNKIFLGGGGGAGHANNPGNIPPSGGNGGGIAIIIGSKLQSNGNKIIANGSQGTACVIGPSPDCHDGMGGGGAGGTILIDVQQHISNNSVETKGAAGINMVGSMAGGRIGPGGGGAGGVLFINNASLPAQILITNTGGTNGVITQDLNNPWGASPGTNGINLFDLQIPFDNTPFLPNIDSVRIKDSATSCNTFDFKGFGYTNTNPINSWQWFFGDGGTANTQNTSHTYSSSGTFIVKLIVTDINGCKDSITRNVNTTAISTEFTYSYVPCLQQTTVFLNGPGNGNWDFGDGSFLNGQGSTLHTYVSPGIYNIKYSIITPTCSDSTTKIFDASIIPDNIIFTQDTTICSGTTKQLLAQPSGIFCWSPTTYLSNPAISNPVTSTPGTITYFYKAETLGNNLITNGNFSAGNSGFTSDYVYQANNTNTTAAYGINTNAQAWNPGASSCTDHTSGTGNMFLANGATTPGLKAWKTTVPVTPNTNYQFSLWLQSISPGNASNIAWMHVYINNKQLASSITAPVSNCQWVLLKFNWTSGNIVSADISLEDFNLSTTANDFALDDIFFGPVYLKRDSVKITVDTASVVTNPNTTICEGLTLQLNTTGGSTYSWSPATGLSNPNIPNPVATPPVTTQYIVTGTNLNGCTAKDTVVITINPAPSITKSNDTTICQIGAAQLFAGGGTGYSWSPAATLNNPSIPNPVATPGSNTTYYVTVTGANSCTKMDSVKVDVRTASSFSINPPVNVCTNSPVQLNASGGDIYSWSPAGSLNNAAIANPIATPAATTIYFVQINDTLCNNTGNLSTTVTALPLPVITATRSNDIDCSVLQSLLSATGANQYNWSPAGSLNNAAIANPVATPTITTLYVVTGTDLSGCTNAASVTVKVSPNITSGYLMPTAFTPNNDGKNDCYGIKNWGTVTQLEFSVYNRWGERVFFTTNPNGCWDGKINGVTQDSNVFVYMIKAKTNCQSEVFRKGTFALIR